MYRLVVHHVVHHGLHFHIAFVVDFLANSTLLNLTTSWAVSFLGFIAVLKIHIVIVVNTLRFYGVYRQSHLVVLRRQIYFLF